MAAGFLRSYAFVVSLFCCLPYVSSSVYIINLKHLSSLPTVHTSICTQTLFIEKSWRIYKLGSAIYSPSVACISRARLVLRAKD